MSTVGRGSIGVTPPRTVVHLITTLIQGGAERVLSEAVPRPNAQGTDGTPERHVVVSLAPGGMFADALREQGVEVRDLGMRTIRDLPRAARRLRALEQELEPACIVAWMYHACLLTLLAHRFRRDSKSSKPHIVWFFRGSLHTLTGFPWHTRLIIQVLRRTSRFPDALAINSRTGLEHHARLGYRPRRWVLLPNGIDSDRFRPSRRDRDAVRSELGISAEATVLVSVARVHPQKDHQTLLEAVELVAARGNGTPIVLMLIGRDTEALDAREGTDPLVLGLGERRDIPRLLRAADLVVSSSRTEGLPNAILEGMASGLVPVATDAGDSSRAVGECGRVVRPGEPQELATAIAELLRLPASERAALGEAARERIRTKYAVDRLKSDYRAFWEAACGIGPYPGAPQRLVHIIARMNVGGPARILAGLLAATDPDRMEQTILAGAVREGEEDWYALHGDDDAQVVRVPSLRSEIDPLADLRALRQLTRLLRTLSPDAVQTHTAKAGLLGRIAAVRAGTPWIVHTFHGHTLHGYFPRSVTWAFTRIERALARRSDRLVTVGARVRDELLASGVGHPDQYAVIPPGIADPGVEDRATSRRALNLPQDAEVVVFIGRLTGVKRPDRFLDAAERIALHRPGVVFLMVGDGELGDTVRAHIGAADVRMLGWRSDIPRVLAASDLVMLTSDNEGMPLTLIEAAFAARCAVTTDVGSAGEVVLDGRTGRVTETTAGALAEAALELLAAPEERARMALAARDHALRTYSLEAVATATAQLHDAARSSAAAVPDA